MTPNPFVEQLFKLLASLTSPLKGYRTALGTVGALGLLLYALMSGPDMVLAGIAFTQLLAILGLRPEEPPAIQAAPDTLHFPRPPA